MNNFFFSISHEEIIPCFYVSGSRSLDPLYAEKQVCVRFLAIAAVWAIAMAAPACSQTESSCSPSLNGNDRPVSLRTLFPNILCDQKRIWTFPVRLGEG